MKNMTLLDGLSEFGLVSHKVEGRSMEPMLYSGRDIVTILKTKPEDVFSVSDVVLFKKKEKPILHRVVKIEGDDCIHVLGDNCSKADIISKNQICGILHSFTHDGTWYGVKDERYLEYIKKLRLCEHKRKRRKYIYDLITSLFRFLDKSSMDRLKKFLDKHVKLRIVF